MTITDDDLITVQLNSGVGTMLFNDDCGNPAVTSSPVGALSPGGFTSGTHGAYQWIVDGQNLMGLNFSMSNNEPVSTTQVDHSGYGHDATVESATFVTSTSGDCQIGSWSPL